MASLEIAFLTGDVERRELSKQQPVSIGSHRTNDIQVDEPDVELIHCRVSWNKTAFEAVAAGVEPIDVNGTMLQRSALKPGDVLRIGTVDFKFLSGEEDEGETSLGDVGLKPLTDELPVLRAESRDAGQGKAPPGKSPPPVLKPRSSKPPHVAKAEVIDDAEEEDDEESRGAGDWSSNLEGLAAESRTDLPVHRSAVAAADERNEVEEIEEIIEEGAIDTQPHSPAPAKPAVVSARMREALRHGRDRPGEEDTLRSPLVLGLGGAAAALLLLAAVFYFIASRQSTQEEFDAAKSLADEGKYAQAIKQFEEFAHAHIGERLEHPARIMAGLARVDRYLSGAVKDWPKALDELRAFIQETRDFEEFEEQRNPIWTRAGDIARGSAEGAGKQFNRKLLSVSDEAVTILTTYAPKDEPPTELLREVATLRRRSEAAVLRHETFQTAMGELDRALQARAPMEALAARRDLLTRYPDFASDPKLAAQLRATLKAETARATSETLDRPALTGEPETGLPAPLTLVFHARSRTDEVSVGQSVIVLGTDCLYGIDTVTGVPVWRRVIGAGSPFFPLREPAVPSVIVFDSNRQELLRLDQNTGALLWRQPLEDAVEGQPLIDEGQIYAPTRGGKLFKIDLQTGAAATCVTFSQPVTGPVALPDGEHLIVAGDREIVYTLTKQPLACIASGHFSQPAGSIEAPLLSMASYVLMIENGPAGQGNVRLIDASQPEQLRQIAAQRVSGRVVDLPVIRGRDLFVPSTRERVTAFGVSDDAGQPPLVLGPSYQVKGDQDSPIFLATGPDRQLWMASSALRKLQLTEDAIEADQNEVAVGMSSQPLQSAGVVLYNARRRPHGDAVTLTQTNRDDLTSDWQAVVGARIIAVGTSSGGSPGLVCLTDAGHIFRIGSRDWSQSGFFENSATRLPLLEDLRTPLLAQPLADGRIVAAAGGKEPKLWVISRAGQIERTSPLDAPLQSVPVPLGDRFVLALPGKLQLSSGAGQLPVQEYSLPSDEAENVEWAQLLPVDDSTVIAVTRAGRLLQVRRQENPRAHLAEVSRFDLGSPIDVRGDAAGDLLVMADASRRLRLINPLNLDTLAEQHMPAAVSNDVWIVGDAVFVETGGDTLHCLDPGNALAARWTTPLDLRGVPLAGRPLAAGSRVIVALQSGMVRAVAAATGEVQKEVSTGCALSGGPIAVGDQIVVPSLDGSLIRLTDLAAD